MFYVCVWLGFMDWLEKRFIIITYILEVLKYAFADRRFPEITGKDNLTVFLYSGRLKSPEWRWQLRRADLRQF